MRVWRRRSRADGSEVAARIRRELAALAPLLHLEEADITLVRFEAAAGLAVLRFEGDCPDCEMPAITMRQAVEAHLRAKVPEIREIRALEERGST